MRQETSFFRTARRLFFTRKKKEVSLPGRHDSTTSFCCLANKSSESVLSMVSVVFGACEQMFGHLEVMFAPSRASLKRRLEQRCCRAVHLVNLCGREGRKRCTTAHPHPATQSARQQIGAVASAELIPMIRSAICYAKPLDVFIPNDLSPLAMESLFNQTVGLTSPFSELGCFNLVCPPLHLTVREPIRHFGTSPPLHAFS